MLPWLDSTGERYDNCVSDVTQLDLIERELLHVLFLRPLTHSEALKEGLSSPTLCAFADEDKVSIFSAALRVWMPGAPQRCSCSFLLSTVLDNGIPKNHSEASYYTLSSTAMCGQVHLCCICSAYGMTLMMWLAALAVHTGSRVLFLLATTVVHIVILVVLSNLVIMIVCLSQQDIVRCWKVRSYLG